MYTAEKVLAAILGVIAGIFTYPLLDTYVWEVLALVGAVAAGVVVYGLVVRVLRDVNRR